MTQNLTAALLILFLLAESKGVFSVNAVVEPAPLSSQTQTQERAINRIEALGALFDHFKSLKLSGSPVIKFKDVRSTDTSYPVVLKACQAKILDCSASFLRAGKEVTQNEFVHWFFQLKYLGKADALAKQYPKINKPVTRSWFEAKRLNLLVGDKLTHSALREFLYRYSASQANGGLPYDSSLVPDVSYINAERFHSPKEIGLIQETLRKRVSEIDALKRPSITDKSLANQFGQYLTAFEKLRQSLLDESVLVEKRPDLDPKILKLIGEYGLQEVLYSYSYDYSKNPAYRKHNLVTGAKRLHGKVLQPGEILDFWKTLIEKGLLDFKYGWVIANGGEEWLFGGGICGSATMAFIPMWKSGLEVVERRNHSLFYSNLYPRDQIGLDATVFRPKPNLIIRNNMDSPVVFNVIDDKKNQILTIEVLGNRTFKSVKVEGPIFINKHAVRWVRHMEGFDGTIVSDTLDSRYNAIY